MSQAEPDKTSLDHFSSASRGLIDLFEGFGKDPHGERPVYLNISFTTRGTDQFPRIKDLHRSNVFLYYPTRVAKLQVGFIPLST